MSLNMLSVVSVSDYKARRWGKHAFAPVVYNRQQMQGWEVRVCCGSCSVGRPRVRLAPVPCSHRRRYHAIQELTSIHMGVLAPLV